MTAFGELLLLRPAMIKAGSMIRVNRWNKNMTNLNTSGDAASYADRATRHVPGMSDMHHMAGLLLSERVQKKRSRLVLGAGGGLELDVLARLQRPGLWWPWATAFR